MASTKKLVLVIIIYTQFFLLAIFLKFFAGFDGCSLRLFDDYTKIAYFSKLL